MSKRDPCRAALAAYETCAKRESEKKEGEVEPEVEEPCHAEKVAYVVCRRLDRGLPATPVQPEPATAKP